MVKGQLLENMEPEVFMIKLNQWQLKMEQKLNLKHTLTNIHHENNVIKSLHFGIKKDRS